MKQYITWSYYTVSEPTVKINGVNVQEEKNGMSVKITPQVETNSTSLKYKYLIYNVDNQSGRQLRIQRVIHLLSGFRKKVEITGFI